MLKKPLFAYSTMDAQSLYNAVKALNSSTSALKGKVSAMPPTTGDDNMATQKSEAEQSQAKFDKAVKEAVMTARKSVNRKIIRQALLEQVRKEINLEFHALVSPAEIDKLANESVNNAMFSLSELKVLPTNISVSAFIDSKQKQGYQHVAEHADLIEEGVGSSSDDEGL